MADDKIPDNYQSDDDDEREDEVMPTPNTAATPVTSSLERSTTIPAQAQDGHYMSELHPPHMVPTDGLPSAHHHPYVDGSSMNHPPLPVPEMMPSPHDTGRRSSVFSPTEFPTPPNPSMYGGGWSQSAAAPANQSMYPFTPQQHSPQQAQGPSSFMAQSGVPMNQTQTYLPPHFDNIARPYDPGQSHMFRSSSVTSPSVVGQPHGYPNYLSHDDRQHHAMKLEATLGRPSLH